MFNSLEGGRMINKPDSGPNTIPVPVPSANQDAQRERKYFYGKLAREGLGAAVSLLAFGSHINALTSAENVATLARSGLGTVQGALMGGAYGERLGLQKWSAEQAAATEELLARSASTDLLQKADETYTDYATRIEAHVQDLRNALKREISVIRANERFTRYGSVVDEYEYEARQRGWGERLGGAVTGTWHLVCGAAEILKTPSSWKPGLQTARRVIAGIWRSKEGKKALLKTAFYWGTPILATALSPALAPFAFGLTFGASTVERGVRVNKIIQEYRERQSAEFTPATIQVAQHPRIAAIFERLNEAGIRTDIEPARQKLLVFYEDPTNAEALTSNDYQAVADYMVENGQIGAVLGGLTSLATYGVLRAREHHGEGTVSQADVGNSAEHPSTTRPAEIEGGVPGPIAGGGVGNDAHGGIGGGVHHDGVSGEVSNGVRSGDTHGGVPNDEDRSPVYGPESGPGEGAVPPPPPVGGIADLEKTTTEATHEFSKVFVEGDKSYVYLDIDGDNRQDVGEKFEVLHDTHNRAYVEMQYFDTDGDGRIHSDADVLDMTKEKIKLYIDKPTLNGGYIGEHQYVQSDGTWKTADVVYAVDKDEWMRHQLGESKWENVRASNDTDTLSVGTGETSGYGLVARKGLIADFGGQAPGDKVPEIQVTLQEGKLVGDWHGAKVVFDGQPISNEQVNDLAGNNEQLATLIRGSSLNYQEKSLTFNHLEIDPSAKMPDGSASTDHFARALTDPEFQKELPNNVTEQINKALGNLPESPFARRRALEDIFGSFNGKKSFDFTSLIATMKEKSVTVEFPDEEVLRNAPGKVVITDQIRNLTQQLNKPEVASGVRTRVQELSRLLERQIDAPAGFTVNYYEDKAYIRAVDSDGNVMTKIILPKEQVEASLRSRP